MTRQVLNRGTTANDGTGDTLRQAALKIEQNFEEIYLKLGGDSNVLMPLVSFDSSGIIFEGSTVNDFETRLAVVDPTADRTVTIPDHTGTVTLNDATQSLENKTLIAPTVTAPDLLSDSSDTYKYTLVVQEPSADRNINVPLLTDSDEVTFNNHAQTLANKTLTTPILINPRIGTELQDSSGNQYIEFDPVASAVNHFKLTSASTGNSPTISAAGANTNIDLNLQGKGTGGVKIRSKFKLDYQNITADGAVNLSKPLTLFDAGGALTITMPNGTEIGEVKHLVNKNSGAATVTPSTLLSYSTITLSLGQTCSLVWGGSPTPGWIVMNVSGDSDGGILG